MAVPLPPLDAYRRDIAALGGQPFGSDDGQWIMVATLLQRFAETPGAERQEIGAQLASHLAVDGELTFCNAALKFEQRIEEAGALHLAASWIAFLEQTIPDDRTLEVGRVRATRARV